MPDVFRQVRPLTSVEDLPLSPPVAKALAAAGLRTDAPPVDLATWRRFLDFVGHEQHGDADVGGVTFRELFDQSPAPTMSQDYSLVLGWMEELRREGITDIRAYLDGRPDLLALAVSQIRITAANPAGIAIIGKPAKDVIGYIDPAIVNRGSHVSWTRQLETVWNGERSALVEFIGARLDGSEFDARLTMVVPEVNGAADYTRVVLTIHDISEQRIREREMQRLVDAKTQFLASVSHEIRTPLTAVLGYAELLKSDTGEMSAAERGELLKIVCNEAQDVAYLVEDLLVAARADLGRLDVLHDVFNVDAEVTATLRGIDFEGNAVAVPVKVDEPRYAVGDPARFRQIVRNLLTNAQRYGGHRVEVLIGETPTYVTIDVIDDGDGIPPSETHRVFALFERIATPERSPESVGIGLSISRQLAEMMGGDLRYSRRGGLTAFQIRIPRMQSIAPRL